MTMRTQGIEMVMVIALLTGACNSPLLECISERRAADELDEHAKELEKFEASRDTQLAHFGNPPEPEHF